jgi:hypothetical protein
MKEIDFCICRCISPGTAVSQPGMLAVESDVSTSATEKSGSVRIVMTTELSNLSIKI